MWYIDTIEYYSVIQKEQSPDTFYSMDKPSEHYLKWKKPETTNSGLFYKVANL
jgi:hypothetical protein